MSVCHSLALVADSWVRHVKRRSFVFIHVSSSLIWPFRLVTFWMSFTIDKCNSLAYHVAHLLLPCEQVMVLFLFNLIHRFCSKLHNKWKLILSHSGSPTWSFRQFPCKDRWSSRCTNMMWTVGQIKNTFDYMSSFRQYYHRVRKS